MTATYHVARFVFCYTTGSKTALDHTTDRGVCFCGLKILLIQLLCIFSCEIIVLPYAGIIRRKHMAIDYEALGKRISNARKQVGITQEALGEQLSMTRKHISVIEAAISRPSLDTLVDIANALGPSADDLLVDSLTHSASTADSEIHRLLLDCNDIEQEILTRMIKEMKAILYGLGI